ncbi:MAG: TIGR04211 family SH3 domain-containing protein [Nitrospirales bacterium]|nr:TIGR04211 family SH3 domain-containing protein [Nitrospira sp.]MDR4502488.1 TIGR04211 family SH3 domain-containing protein [Nitrospirales bacterium]
MKCWKSCVGFLSVFLVLTLFSHLFAAVGDVNYISDELKVPLRSGPSTAHRILHRGLPSGTQLTILAVDEEEGFTQIRTDGGTEGWLPSQYLVVEPIARHKLTAANRRIQQLQSKLDEERKTRVSIQTEYKDAETNNRTLSSQAQTLSKELEDLKRISGDAMNEHARNVELSKQNERLVEEVGQLSTTVRNLEANVERDWLLYGGGLVLIGLILGIMLKARPQRPGGGYSRYS